MPKRRRRRRLPLYSAGLIERADNSILIARLCGEPDAPRLWCFPRDLAAEEESPEAAMRRFARDYLGIAVEIVVGQPPLVELIDGRNAELRYFFCGIAAGEPRPGPYAELRWVSRPHLREYDFDRPSHPVAIWLAEGGR